MTRIKTVRERTSVPSQCLGGLTLSAKESERSDLGQRHDLRNGRKLTSEPPWELMGDDHPHEVRTTHREVYGDRGPGARTDHDGGLARKDSRITAASAVCVEIERAGSPPDRA